MAKIQHFLPQLLLRGFASRTKRKQGRTQFFVRVFPREAAEYEANVKNIGAEGFFYQPEETGGIEERLSKQETRCSLMLERFRRGEPVAHDDVPLICEFVATLIVRTRHLRDGLAAVSQMVGDSIARAWEDPQNETALRRQVRQWADEPDNRKFLAQLPPHKRAQALKKLEGLFLDQFPRFVRQKTAGLNFGQLATNAQRRTLAANLAPEQRVKTLAKLQWSVCEAQPHTYILADVGPVGVFPGESAIELLIKHVSVPRAVYLPISHSRLLVGSGEDDAGVPDEDALNWAAAELSRECFVASRSSDAERRLHGTLGRRANPLSAEEMDRMQEKGLRGD